jgi:ribosome-associated toxin RatA of RatAB toxin-antitoxin module
MHRHLLRTAYFVVTVTAFGCASGDLRVDHSGTKAPSAASRRPGEGGIPAGAREVADARRPSGASTDAQRTSPAADDPEPTAIPIPGSELVRGRATVTVKASIEKVRETIVAFAEYPEFMPHYQKAKVLGRTPSGARDVYMEIEALHGAITMWTRIEFPKPAIIDGVETYETKYVDGNVKDFKAIWRLKKIDDASTELSLEVFLLPKIPLPSGVLNGENMKGSVKGVVAMRARVEGRAR